MVVSKIGMAPPYFWQWQINIFFMGNLVPNMNVGFSRHMLVVQNVGFSNVLLGAYEG
jgi:hypothetical protein